MILSNMLSNLRIELQDMDEILYKDDELVRAIEKSISLMSRLLPKRDLISKTLTSGMIEFTYLLNISTILSDYIRIERVEYPANQSPAQFPTFDVVGNYLMFRGSLILTVGDVIRLIYLRRWVSPTPTTEGDYPSHLNDAVIIGSAGQALIFKAEKYVQSSANRIDSIVLILAAISNLVLTVPDLTPPTAPTLDTLIPPSEYAVVKPTSPSLPSAPTAPTAPSLDFIAVEAALTEIATEITASKAKLTSGETLINAATRGEAVAATYGNYSSVIMVAAGHRVNEAVARLRQIEENLAKYASQVTSYGSDVNAYANNISSLIGKYREEINSETLGISNASVRVTIFTALVNEQNLKINKFSEEVRKYQAEIAEFQNEIAAYTIKVNGIINRAAQEAVLVGNYLDIAGRYLASGQSKINEFLISLGLKLEFPTQKASSEQRS